MNIAKSRNVIAPLSGFGAATVGGGTIPIC
jgi:hypothetical protein